MENSNEITNQLTLLLGICNDGKEGYKNAASNADSAELKALFTTYSIQRSEFAMDLKTCIRQSGGDPDNEKGGPLGALHRTWMDIKTAFTSNDDKAILDACITGEKAAVESYDKALERTDLSPNTRQMLISQRADISESLRNIENLEHQYA